MAASYNGQAVVQPLDARANADSSQTWRHTFMD